MTVSSSELLDLSDPAARERLLPLCRLTPGQAWCDQLRGHVVACGDATDATLIRSLLKDSAQPNLAVHDPPYNLVAFERRPVDEYINWCRRWIDITHDLLADDASLYVWLGADQKRHFQPLPQFMAMIAATQFESRSIITMRYLRGYGTRNNWMAVRHELLYYFKGAP
ncbi:MAG: DNA methyltransferase, partial [candidate division Zixibacteria bacterium]|nr:DNA methyltransferase [candidate division Zixibacteria bacterium]